MIATAFREGPLAATLRSLAAQSRVPEEIVVVDGDPQPGIERVVKEAAHHHGLNIIYSRLEPPSAAVQRNVGTKASSGEVILFLDDDAYPEPDCLEKMMQVLEEDAQLRVGGVGVLIRNQLCLPPRWKAKRWLDFLADEIRPSYSGMVVGPAINIGPEPTADGRVVPVEWLNCGCTAYRRAALPDGGFNSRFTGYSYMEDVDLSVRVARRWKLVVHTGACIYHDTQPSRFKRPYTRARMGVQNRYYVMTATLGRTSLRHHLKFLATVGMGLLFGLRGMRRPGDFADWLLALCGTIRGLGGVSGFLATRGWRRHNQV